MKWLAECSVAALREALGTVAPELSGYPVTVPGSAGQQDPLWHPGCVPAGDRFFVTFAWSRPAALRLAREIGVLTAPACDAEVPFVPEVVASSADLHGDNRVRDRDELRLVLDFENIGAAEPEYELRGFPGPGLGPWPGAADRDHAPLPAGHRTAAVARPGNGLASAPRPRRRAVAQRSRLPPTDHRTLPQWVEDLAARFSTLSIDPEAPPANQRQRHRQDRHTTPRRLERAGCHIHTFRTVAATSGSRTTLTPARSVPRAVVRVRWRDSGGRRQRAWPALACRLTRRR